MTLRPLTDINIIMWLGCEELYAWSQKSHVLSSKFFPLKNNSVDPIRTHLLRGNSSQINFHLPGGERGHKSWLFYDEATPSFN